MPTNKIKMQAPDGFSAGTIEGAPYEPDAKGQVQVIQESHIEPLRQHGFTDVVESSETADDIKMMDREALTEYIEERGGTVDANTKPKKLKIQALRAGGFTKEADTLAK